MCYTINNKSGTAQDAELKKPLYSSYRFYFYAYKGGKYMSKKKTHEQYVEEVSKINSNIEVIGMYQNSKTKIAHLCKIDGHKWNAYSSNVLKGHGCPECMKRNLHNRFAKSHENYVEDVFKISPFIEVVGDYINSQTPILHRCNKHNIEWNISPVHVLQGCGCYKCKGEKIYNSKVKDIDTYIYEVSQINKNIEVIGEYINARTPIFHKCSICGCTWKASPDNILSGYGCPECNFSKGEKCIQEYLTKYNIKYCSQYIFDDCKNMRALPFDFYLPDYNICIEYDGIQHFEPIEFFGGYDALRKQQHNDTIKTNYCNLHNIGLIRIKYSQNIDKILDDFFDNTKLIKEAI